MNYGIVLVRQRRQTPDSDQYTALVVDDELTQRAFESLQLLLHHHNTILS
jgi:hypothetical protein